MEFTNGGYSGYRSVGGRDWKGISQFCKDKLFGTKQGQLLTGITNRTIETRGIPFRNVMALLNLSDVSKHTHQRLL